MCSVHKKSLRMTKEIFKVIAKSNDVMPYPDDVLCVLRGFHDLVSVRVIKQCVQRLLDVNRAVAVTSQRLQNLSLTGFTRNLETKTQ